MSIDRTMSRAKGLERKGQMAAAVALYQEALDRFPKNATARAGVKRIEGSQVGMAHQNLGVVLTDVGRKSEAPRHFSAHWKLIPIIRARDWGCRIVS